MLAIPDPAEAILLGLRITHELMRGHGAPAVRVGLHHGPAIERDGDYFGAAVNLAARVSGEASGGEVMLTGQTAALAPGARGGALRAARPARAAQRPRAGRAVRRRAGAARPHERSFPATRSAGWRSTPSARPAASPTRTPPTTSARSPAPPSSRATPSASRHERRASDHRPAAPPRPPPQHVGRRSVGRVRDGDDLLKANSSNGCGQEGAGEQRPRRLARIRPPRSQAAARSGFVCWRAAICSAMWAASCLTQPRSAEPRVYCHCSPRNTGPERR